MKTKIGSFVVEIDFEDAEALVKHYFGRKRDENNKSKNKTKNSKTA